MTQQEFIKKLPTIDKYYVIFCQFTKMPYAECDVETFDDKIFIFLDEAKANAFVEEYKEDKMLLFVKTIGRAEILNFFTTMISTGINMISFRGEEDFNIEVDKIVRRELKEGMAKPIENPQLQLSMAYFMQAVRTAETQEEQMIARQFEEEMMVNIARGHFLVPSKDLEEPDEEGKRKVAFLQVKNTNGDAFVPLFTDLTEFGKFDSQFESMKFMVMSFQKLQTVKMQNLGGFIINPASISIVLNEQHMKVVAERFPQEIEEAANFSLE